MVSFWRRWLTRWWRKAAKKILRALCKRLWRRAWETEDDDDGGGGPDQHVIAWREQPLFQTRSVLRSPMDPSMLDRSLYSVVSGGDGDDDGDEEDRGRRCSCQLCNRVGEVLLALHYCQELQTLHVRLMEVLLDGAPRVTPISGGHVGGVASRWAARSAAGHCTLALMPGAGSEERSVGRWGPPAGGGLVFEESFSFALAPPELARRSLLVRFFRADSFSRHQLAGQAHVPLVPDTGAAGRHRRLGMVPRVVRHSLLRVPSQGFFCGELLLSLGYCGRTERLTVIVLKARGLAAAHGNFTDAHVKVTVLESGRPQRARKTKRVPLSTAEAAPEPETPEEAAAAAPVFNERLALPLATGALSRARLLVRVRRREERRHRRSLLLLPRSPAVELGRLMFSAEARGGSKGGAGGGAGQEEADHWRCAVLGGRAEARWHRLRLPDPTSCDRTRW
ncbi:synaptotagmin-17-like [Petromyzon marinus]|uniref:synaptotagmin-17-like n=1 Tax=Petromyzon marinus TaxID=7757 RepID=UPI003F6F6155